MHKTTRARAPEISERCPQRAAVQKTPRNPAARSVRAGPCPGNYTWARFYAPQLGRFTSRDPIGYTAGVNLVELATDSPINANDPSGLWTAPSLLPPSRRISFPPGVLRGGLAVTGTPCGVTMQTGEGVFGDGGLGTVIGDDRVFSGASSQDEIIAAIPSDCCTLYLIGHRGNPPREGGIGTRRPTVGNPDVDHEIIPILPDPWFGSRLRDKFFGAPELGGNCCKECVINLVTCGGDTPEGIILGDIRRQHIANTTGCKVCGTATTCPPISNAPVLLMSNPAGWNWRCKLPQAVLPRWDGGPSVWGQ
jgi:hypothetical protein